MDSSKKIVDLVKLKRLLARQRRQGCKIVFTNGCFDILHAGHVSYLEAAKKNDRRVLVIGLNSDQSVRSLSKGPERPVIPQDQRAKLLAALACVDYVVSFNEPTPEILIREVLPDVLVKGADWQGKEVAGAATVKSAGGRVEFLEYKAGLSTSNIIDKIRRQG